MREHAFRVLLVVLAVAMVPPGSTLALRRDPPVDRLGRPVQDALGQRIVYAPSADDRPRAAKPVDRDADAAALLPSGVTARWGYAGFGEGIGEAGIVLSDGEIITGGSGYISSVGWTDYFYILRPAGSGYAQVFVSRPFPGL